MDPERDDYEDRDVPVAAIESPAALLELFARTAGMVALCLSAVLALLLLAAMLIGLLLR